MKAAKIAICAGALVLAVLAAAPVLGEAPSETALESSIARIKDGLKQEQAQRGNAVSSSLEQWRAGDAGQQGVGVRLIKGLGLCVGAFLIGAALYQRLRGRGVRAPRLGSMRVVEKLPLTSKTALMLVECEGRRLLVAVGSERVAFHDAEETASAAAFELACEEEARPISAAAS